jgi:peptidyl-prolyl cis-trans isomerase C
MNSRKRQLAIALIAVTSLSTFGFLGFNSKETVAKVSHKKITKTDLENQINALPEKDKQLVKSNPQAKQQILNQMIDQELVAIEAKKEGYTRSDDYKTQLDNYKRNLLINMFINDKVNKNVQVSREEVQAFFQQNQAQFSEKKERNVAHILISTAERTDAEARAKANNVARQVKTGKSDFAKAAATHSDHAESKNKGGELGYFQKGQLKKEFSDAAFKLNANGQIAGPVKTDLGYHIIKLLDTRTRPAIPLAQVQQQIAQSIAQAKSRQLQEELLSSLKEKYTVEVIETNLN